MSRNVPQSLGLTTLTVLFEAFKIDRKDVARGYSLLAVEAAGIKSCDRVIYEGSTAVQWLNLFQYTEQIP